ncbi:MAG: efflux RND transporter periplasmic adaptor subunit, partial [Pseudomonadota bacterium]
MLQVAVDVGDRVAAGSVIARLDADDREVDLIEARARLAEARARLTELETGTRAEIVTQRRAELSAARARAEGARDNLDRIDRLVRDGALSQRALIEARAEADAAVGDRARAEASLAEAVAGPRQEEIAAQRGTVAVAEAAVARAELELNRVEIVANASGTVSQKSVAIGDTVEENDPIVELVNRERLDVFLEVPEAVSGRVRPGQEVTLQARALPGWQVTAPIAGTLPTAAAASRRQMVRVRLENDSPD